MQSTEIVWTVTICLQVQIVFTMTEMFGHLERLDSTDLIKHCTTMNAIQLQYLVTYVHSAFDGRSSVSC